MVATDEKRYLIFAGYRYESNGGARDYIDWQYELDEAKKVANNQVDDSMDTSDWAHVLDTQTMEIVYEVKQ